MLVSGVVRSWYALSRFYAFVKAAPDQLWQRPTIEITWDSEAVIVTIEESDIDNGKVFGWKLETYSPIVFSYEINDYERIWQLDIQERTQIGSWCLLRKG